MWVFTASLNALPSSCGSILDCSRYTYSRVFLRCVCMRCTHVDGDCTTFPLIKMLLCRLLIQCIVWLSCCVRRCVGCDGFIECTSFTVCIYPGFLWICLLPCISQSCVHAVRPIKQYLRSAPNRVAEVVISKYKYSYAYLRSPAGSTGGFVDECSAGPNYFVVSALRNAWL